MPAYIVATVSIVDPERFASYGKAIAGLGERYGADYLLRGTVAEVLEGDAVAGERVVVIRFPDADAARGYIRSTEYQAAAAARSQAASVVMRLIVDPT